MRHTVGVCVRPARAQQFLLPRVARAQQRRRRAYLTARTRAATNSIAAAAAAAAATAQPLRPRRDSCGVVQGQ